MKQSQQSEQPKPSSSVFVEMRAGGSSIEGIAGIFKLDKAGEEELKDMDAELEGEIREKRNAILAKRTEDHVTDLQNTATAYDKTILRLDNIIDGANLQTVIAIELLKLRLEYEKERSRVYGELITELSEPPQDRVCSDGYNLGRLRLNNV